MHALEVQLTLKRNAETVLLPFYILSNFRAALTWGVNLGRNRHVKAHKCVVALK